MKIDFKELKEALLPKAFEICQDILPGGDVEGAEFKAASITGGKGNSLKVNLRSGRWADFATDDKGGDIISLYAASKSISQIESARELIRNYNITCVESKTFIPKNQSSIELGYPPSGTNPPNESNKFGTPTARWLYKTHDSKPWFWVYRYETKDGKQVIPWCWSKTTRKWVMKSWPEPRPLYNLDRIVQNPDRSILICEGEKAADAASEIMGHVYISTTWPNGCKSYNKVDWNPIKGRKVLIWPDADDAGLRAADSIAKKLTKLCKEVKVINVKKNGGWDAADALQSGWKWDKVKEWAKEKIKVYEKESKDADELTEMEALWIKLDIPLNEKGNPIASLDAACRVLEGMPEFKGRIWYDEFHSKIFMNDKHGKIREMDDDDAIIILKFMQRRVGLHRITEAMVRSAIVDYAKQNKRNEPKDWMNTLKWDGVCRIDSFFMNAFGAENSVYVNAASRNFWISMVARILQPGCKVDNMVILEGFQGKKKSMSLGEIAKGWFSEVRSSVSSKDFYVDIQGKLLVEIAELDSFTKAESTAIKQAISCQNDRFRPPYGRTSRDFPRQCIFVGTTNETTYLKDHTGGRRFWPIRTHAIDVDYIKNNRDQLFAEAMDLFNSGVKWWDMPDEAKRQQEMRRQYDVWEGVISKWLALKTGKIELADVVTDALDIEIGKVDQRTLSRVNRVMTVLGWKQTQEESNYGFSRVWIKNEIT